MPTFRAPARHPLCLMPLCGISARRVLRVMRSRRRSGSEIDVLWVRPLMPTRPTGPKGCVWQIQMRQPHLDLAIALRDIPHAEQVHDRWSGGRGRQVRIKPAQRHHDADEPPEAQAAQSTVLEPADRRLGQTAAAAQLPLRPAEGRSPAFDDAADDLPPELDIRMSFTSRVDAPWHEPRLSAGAHHAVAGDFARAHRDAAEWHQRPCLCHWEPRSGHQDLHLELPLGGGGEREPCGRPPC